MAYTSAIFFDNDPNNIANVSALCNRIQCVAVPEGRENLISFTKEPLKSYLKTIPGNEYAAYVKEVYTSNGKEPQDIYDPISGIKRKEINILNTWLTSGEGKRAAIFDWDRTITTVEGFLSLNRPLTDKFKEDMLIYLLGGKLRLQTIRQMFQDCRNNGVDIIILTNNGGCKYDFFDELLLHLIQGPYNKICSNSLTGKGLFLARDTLFQNLCTKLHERTDVNGNWVCVAGAAAALLVAGASYACHLMKGGTRKNRTKKTKKP